MIVHPKGTWKNNRKHYKKAVYEIWNESWDRYECFTYAWSDFTILWAGRVHINKEDLASHENLKDAEWEIILETDRRVRLIQMFDKFSGEFEFLKTDKED